MTQKPVNLQKIINEFDKAYGRPHLSLTVSDIDHTFLYLRILYEKNVPVTEDNLAKDGNLFLKPDNTANIYVMCRIWINEETDEIGNRKHTYTPILWKDAIYINDFIMPLKDRQQNFLAAMNKWCDGYGDYLLGSYQPVELGQSILHQARKMAISKLKQASEMTERLFKEHKTHYLLHGETIAEQTESLFYHIKGLEPVVDCVLYNMNNRGAIPQPST